MSNFTLKTARVVGTPDENTWAQIHAVDSLFLVLVLEKSSQVALDQSAPLAAIGKELLSRIEDRYRQSTTNNLATFRALCESVVNETSGCTVSTLVAGMTVGEVLYIGAKGGAVLFKRKGVLKTILRGQEQFGFASGMLVDGDLVSLMSVGLLAQIESRLHEFFTSDDPQEVAEAIVPLAHQSSQQGAIAAFFAKPQVSSVLALEMSEQALLSEPDEQNQKSEPEKPLVPPAGGERVKRTFSLRKLLNFLPLLRLGTVLQDRSRRVIATVFLFLIILFVLSLVLGVQKRTQDEYLAQFTHAMVEATQKYDEGMALSDLNPQLSVKMLLEAKKIVDEASPRVPRDRSNEKDKLVELAEKIDEGLRVAFRIETISEAPVYFDLTVIKEGAVGTAMSLFEDTVVILDSKSGALYTLIIPKKQGALVSGNIPGPIHEALGIQQGFVLDSDGIEQVSFTTKKRELVVEQDAEWGDIGSISYYGGNLYLLDKTKGHIYKYQGTESGFSRRREYLAPDMTPDFTKSVSMAIDGAVWVLFSDGRVNKFSQGASAPFSISGMDIYFSDPSVLFTDEESKHLYILDHGNKRIVVCKKDGTYVSQYRWDGIANVSDIVVSEKEKKILLLAGSKIYSIPLSF